MNKKTLFWIGGLAVAIPALYFGTQFYLAMGGKTPYRYWKKRNVKTEKT